MPLYTYQCERGHRSELLRSRDVETERCSCGLASYRDTFNRVAVIGNAPVPHEARNHRQAFSEYTAASAEVADYYGKRRANGDPVNPPDYYAIARQQARAKGAALR